MEAGPGGKLEAIKTSAPAEPPVFVAPQQNFAADASQISRAGLSDFLSEELASPFHIFHPENRWCRTGALPVFFPNHPCFLAQVVPS